MPKIHELLAIDANLKGQSLKVRTDTTTNFEKRQNLFTERRKTFQSLEENAKQEVTIEEQTTMQTTVAKELLWMTKHVIRSLDASFLVDKGNTQAKADIVTEDGEVLYKDVPATFLLSLEKRVKEIKDVLGRVQTLDSAKGFKLDPDFGEHVYVARELDKVRTRKDTRARELSKATDKHPAQFHLEPYDVVTGKVIEQEWSSLLTPGLKAELMEQAETLFRAVTSARSKANELTVDGKEKIGEALMEFLFRPMALI